jgi:hypothetical protein
MNLQCLLIGALSFPLNVQYEVFMTCNLLNGVSPEIDSRRWELARCYFESKVPETRITELFNQTLKTLERDAGAPFRGSTDGLWNIFIKNINILKATAIDAFFKYVFHDFENQQVEEMLEEYKETQSFSKYSHELKIALAFGHEQYQNAMEATRKSISPEWSSEFDKDKAVQEMYEEGKRRREETKIVVRETEIIARKTENGIVIDEKDIVEEKIGNEIVIKEIEKELAITKKETVFEKKEQKLDIGKKEIVLEEKEKKIDIENNEIVREQNEKKIVIMK